MKTIVKNQEENNYLSTTDTIAAISTAVGDAGIAIVRISGSQAFSVADAIFRIQKNSIQAVGKGVLKPEKKILSRMQSGHTVATAAVSRIQSGHTVATAAVSGMQSGHTVATAAVSGMQSHCIFHGYIHDSQSGQLVDEVMLVKMDAPKTYTKEDTVEIQCHGGSTVVREVLRCVFAAGARPAEAGEFTKRAFLNGRIDLIEAEAVMDMIQSHTAHGSRAAAAQLEGQLSERIRAMREALLMLIGQMAVNLDYPEFDAEEVTLKAAEMVISDVLQQMEKLISQYHYGRILREGFNLVIAGKPNAGKSSLMNRLTGQDRSIVTDIPGTTRDIVESFVNIKGLPVRILDTAGLRETVDVIEKIGVDRTVDAMAQAEMVLAVFDGSVMPAKEDVLLIKQLETLHCPVLYVVNKVDCRHPKAEAALIAQLPKTPLFVSALEGTGLADVTDTIVQLAAGVRYEAGQEVLLTNERHKVLLDKAKDNLTEALLACQTQLTHDVLAFLLREAWEQLGEITGETATDALINNIFARFCLGK